MKPIKRILLSVGISLIVCSTVVGCGDQKGDNQNKLAAQFADDDKWPFGAIKQADQVVLFEGLPHPTWESELLAEERRTKETVTLHDFSFYSEPLEINQKDKDQLKSLLGEERSFHPWIGEANCGGFHPDYLVEAHVSDVTYQFQICFGCGEVWVYGPEKNLRYHMMMAEKPLKTLLGKHRKNRPIKESRVKETPDGKR